MKRTYGFLTMRTVIDNDRHGDFNAAIRAGLAVCGRAMRISCSAFIAYSYRGQGWLLDES